MTAVREALWDETTTDAAPGGLDALIATDWSFEASTSRRLTHDLHPWPAKFIPDIPALAIRALTSPGDTVLDPFAGCGTTAVECRAARRSFVAADVNSLAVRIAEGKCETPSAGERADIRRWAASLRPEPLSDELLGLAPDIPNRDYWFDPPVVAQLAALRRHIADLGIAQAFLETAFSSIIVRVSHQESETRYRRVKRVVDADTVLCHFRRRLDVGLQMAEEFDSLGSNSLSRRYVTCDARTLGEVVAPESVQLAVFSPPYPNSFDYHLYHRFRMFWLGFDPRPVKHQEIGAHLRYEPRGRWEADMAAVLAGLVRALKPGGHIVCVVGDGIISGERVPSADLLSEAAEHVGLRGVWRTTRPVARQRRAFNLADTRLREEQVLVMAR